MFFHRVLLVTGFVLFSFNNLLCSADLNSSFRPVSPWVNLKDTRGSATEEVLLSKPGSPVVELPQDDLKDQEMVRRLEKNLGVDEETSQTLPKGFISEDNQQQQALSRSSSLNTVIIHDSEDEQEEDQQEKQFQNWFSSLSIAAKAYYFAMKNPHFVENMIAKTQTFEGSTVTDSSLTKNSSSTQLPSSAAEAYERTFDTEGLELFRVVGHRNHLDSGCSNFSDYHSAVGENDEDKNEHSEEATNTSGYQSPSLQENLDNLVRSNSPITTQQNHDDGRNSQNSLEQRSVSNFHNDNPAHLSAETLLLFHLNDNSEQPYEIQIEQKGPGIWTLLGNALTNTVVGVGEAIVDGILDGVSAGAFVAHSFLYSDDDDTDPANQTHEKTD